MNPIPFPAGIARDMARVRILANDLRRMVDDLDHHAAITPNAHARIGNLADDAWSKAHDLQAALNQVSLTAADRMCAEQDRSYSIDNAKQLVAAISEMTDGVVR